MPFEYSIEHMRAGDVRGKTQPGRDTVVPQMRPPVPGTGRRLDTFPWRARGLALGRVPAQARTGGGDALETEARLAAEQELAAGAGAAFDLSAVRIHSDAEAGALTRAMRATAVTVGDDIYFAAGRFRPDTRPGRALIAHELTHVEQQRRDGRLRLQLSPDPPDQQPQSAGGAAAGSLQLPWSGQDSSLFEVTSSGIRFLVAVPTAKEKQIRAVIPQLSAQIVSDNKRIRTPALRVTTCLIADPPVAEFVRWQGAPTVLLNLPNANTETVAHEMGHPTFEAFTGPAATGGSLVLPEDVRALLARQEAAADREIRLRFASLYVRLSQTRKRDNSTVPVGLDMVDPARWAPGKWGEEHPKKNVDEFFASAKAAYQIDRKALQSSIRQAARIDNRVGPLGREMIDLLDVVYRNPATLRGGLTPEEREAAEAVLPHGPDEDTDVETFTATCPLLNWLIHPSFRPPVRSAPQATKPSSAPASKQP